MGCTGRNILCIFTAWEYWVYIWLEKRSVDHTGCTWVYLGVTWPRKKHKGQVYLEKGVDMDTGSSQAYRVLVYWPA